MAVPEFPRTSWGTLTQAPAPCPEDKSDQVDSTTGNSGLQGHLQRSGLVAYPIGVLSVWVMFCTRWGYSFSGQFWISPGPYGFSLYWCLDTCVRTWPCTCILPCMGTFPLQPSVVYVWLNQAKGAGPGATGHKGFFRSYQLPVAH